MKRIKILAALLLFILIGNVHAQGDLEKKAIKHANEMVKFYNTKDFRNYVDYLLPTTYGNEAANKKKFVEVWEKITAGDSSKVEILQVLKTSVVEGQYQALFLDSFRDKEGFIFGVSDDKGENWFFTTPFSKEIQFDQIIENIPSIDKSFAKIVDPGYGKRINYEIGKPVTSFNYVDINGNLLSSDSLKGKVIVLNFWFTSCAPCIQEIPELNEMVKRMKGKEVVFIAPAIYTDKETLTHTFLPKHPFKYQIVLIDNKEYSVTSFPTHILIDQESVVIERISGYSPDNIKKLEQKIEELLNPTKING